MPRLSISVDPKLGTYSLSVGNVSWYTSPGSPTLCVHGKEMKTTLNTTQDVSGNDKQFGAWEGIEASFAGDGGVEVVYTFKSYTSGQNSVVVGTASYPNGLDTTGCGPNTALSTRFPEFLTGTPEKTKSLLTMTWCGVTLSKNAVSRGLGGLSVISGLDCGPVVSMEEETGLTVIWSTLDYHKIMPQSNMNGTYAMGISAAIPSIPKGFNHSIIFSLATGE